MGEHFALLARREFACLQQILGCDENALHGARALIRTLEPRPGCGFAPNDTRYVVPDVIVGCRRGRWVATLNPAVQPKVQINRAYADIAAGRSGCGPTFSRQLATDDGGSCSATAIRALLKELIAAENPRTPLSDAQLARMLAEQGLPLARRTVTTYHPLLRVPSVELRRATAARAPLPAQA